MRKALYNPDDLKNFDYHRKLGAPGEYPYTRGIYPTMYSGRLWTMRQYAGYATAEESNRRYRYLLDHGQTGLSVAFDLPTQMGFDSDHPMAQGEVGKTGVAIDTLADTELLFKNIPLDKVSTSMTINATAAILLAMYIVVAEKQGVNSRLLSGTVQNDVLKEYFARGTYIYPPASSMKIAVDIIEYCSKNLPRWNSISISGYHIREAGATAVQEIAFTFANAIAYVQHAIDKAQLDVDDFAPRLSFFFNAHNDFFEEVAKFRAARRIWARIMREDFKAKDPRSWMLRFHTQTAGCTLTAQEPDNNAIRVAYQALAAVLGGTQSLHTNSRDEALSLPSESSVRLALRTQQIIGYESCVPQVIDPLGGSYYVESLTDQLESGITAYLSAIKEMGGALKAIDRGYFSCEIHNSAYQYQKAVEEGDISVVGINRFAESKPGPDFSLLKVTRSVVSKQLKRLQVIKKNRDGHAVSRSLQNLSEAATRGDNVMAPIIECVKTYATLGEISNTLREVYGEHEEKKIF